MTYQEYRLGDICRLVKGTFSSTKTLPGEYPLVVTAAQRRTADGFDLEGPAVCIPLISSTGHGDAAIHRLHYQEGPFALANLLVALIPLPDSPANAEYLYWYLTAKKDEVLVPLMRGTANVSLKEKDIAEVYVPLPPLPEQQRIVARVKGLLAKVEEAQRLRGEVQKGVAALGKVAHTEIYEAAAARGTIRTLAEISRKITDGTHHTPTYVSAGVPFISVKDISSGTIDFSSTKFISSEEHLELIKRCHPEFGDVLLTKVGTTGIAKWIDTEQEFSLFVSVALIKPDKSTVNPAYLEMILNSPPIKILSEENTRGVGNKNLVLKFIREFPIPMPTLQEQGILLKQYNIERLRYATAYDLQVKLDQELQALPSSILAQAFAGAL